jgi:hypothetical protein
MRDSTLQLKIKHKQKIRHKQKMADKVKKRDLEYRSTGTPMILANLSKNHPDYGMSPAEHLRAKQERAA